MNWQRALRLLPMLLVLILGLRLFIQRYPGYEQFRQGAHVPTTLLDSAVSPEWAAAMRDTNAISEIDSMPISNPFRQPVYASSVRNSPSIPRSIPLRKWQLRGTTGNNVATLVDSLGIKHLLRAGESMHGSVLIEVHANHVLMRDAAGTFELNLSPKP